MLRVPQNDIMKQALTDSGVVSVMANEEDDEPLHVPGGPQRGLVAVFDPLDGSRNIEVSIPTGKHSLAVTLCIARYGCHAHVKFDGCNAHVVHDGCHTHVGLDGCHAHVGHDGCHAHVGLDNESQWRLHGSQWPQCVPPGTLLSYLSWTYWLVTTTSLVLGQWLTRSLPTYPAVLCRRLVAAPGTIFGAYRCHDTGGRFAAAADVLQPGNQLLCAGYIL